MIAFVENDRPIPALLEAARYCECLHLTPEALGYDSRNPRIVRAIAMSLNLFEWSSDRQRAKDRAEWDRRNPDAARIIRSARGTLRIGDLAPGQVIVEIPSGDS